MIFNEDEFFSGDLKDLKDDLLHTSMAKFAELLESITLLETGLLELGRLEDALPETTVEDDTKFIVPIGLDIDQDQDSPDWNSQDQCEQDDFGPYPTLEQTPTMALLAYSI